MEKATVYTGCFECDFEAEFHGVVDEWDVAHFDCPNCKEEFTIADWPSFFDDEEGEF